MRTTRIRTAALVPLLVGMIAGVVILGTADPTPDLPAKGVGHVERPEIPVELGPATVVVP